MQVQGQSSAKGKSPSFFSLQWRLAVILNITLLLVSLAVVFIADRLLTDNFDVAAEEEARHDFRDWYGMLADNSDALLRLATFVPLLEIADRSGQLTAAERMAHIFNEHSALLDLEWGVQSIAFYTGEETADCAWPEEPNSREVLSTISSVRKSQTPAGLVDCSPGCIHYLAVPQLKLGRGDGGTLLIGRSLADAIVSFAATSGSELVVLKPWKETGVTMVQADRYLRSWGNLIPALSHPNETLPVVKALSETFPLRALERNPLFQFSDRWYRAAISSEGKGESVYLLLTEVTDQVERLEEMRRDIMLTGLIGFLLTCVLVFWTLHVPLRRLKNLVAMLPLIATQQHLEARNRLPRLQKEHIGDDEIDMLIRAVGEMNEQLWQSDQARLQAEHRLLWLADHDPLTDLYNRRRFERDFDFLIKQALRHDHTGALLYFDLDDFRTVNDLSGHQAGDRLLKKVSDKIRNVVRSTDLFARLGGDEFAVVLTETSEEYTTVLAEKLQNTLRQIEFAVDDRVHHISASIGIVLFPQHGSDVKELLANADITMYQAKKSGHGRWQLFSDNAEVREILSSRALWRDKVAHALEHDGLVLHFQPILDIANHTITRHEVLVRMRDSDGSLIYPDRFIPVAEQSGQIHAIDRWVVGRAIELIRSTPGLSLSVNLSGSVVDSPGLLEWIQPQMMQHDFDPSRLVFEITETAAVQNIAGARKLMHEMHMLGCRFALDDFGSGFASYIYLKELPVSLVKIDGAFIKQLPDNHQDQLFVKSLSEVASGLGMQIVAEFVEDARTLELLRGYGVTYAQGYHVGRPGGDIVYTVNPEESAA